MTELLVYLKYTIWKWLLKSEDKMDFSKEEYTTGIPHRKRHININSKRNTVYFLQFIIWYKSNLVKLCVQVVKLTKNSKLQYTSCNKWESGTWLVYEPKSWIKLCTNPYITTKLMTNYSMYQSAIQRSWSCQMLKNKRSCSYRHHRYWSTRIVIASFYFMQWNTKQLVIIFVLHPCFTMVLVNVSVFPHFHHKNTNFVVPFLSLYTPFIHRNEFHYQSMLCVSLPCQMLSAF